VAHELRGPLVGIEFYAQLLEQQLSEEGPPRRLARKLLTGVADLLALVEDMLLFAQTRTPKREVCSLLDVVERALESTRPPLYERDIQLVRLYAGELPEVEVDPHLLGCVLRNIIKNAVEVMPTGGELVVALRPRPTDALMQEVRFQDTGPGFSARALRHLFQPFVSDKLRGVGLGLAVAQRIVQAHGGRIEVTNRRQGGALVSVSLPVG